MREQLSTITHLNMAFTDCSRTSEHHAASNTNKTGIKRRNWRNQIRFLLKTNSAHSVLHHLRNKSTTARPSAEEVEQWAESLDKLLSHKYGKAAFCVFLKSEFCEENIEFWTACEDFKVLQSHKDMKSKANSIYREFIQSEAPREINLDYHTKNAIAQSLQDPSASSFQAAQRKVYSLMENNSYPRFIHSDLYRELSAAAGGPRRAR